jgi:hypothetical protein
MPLATIWRDPRAVTDKQVLAIRVVVQFAVQEVLGVDLNQVEVRVLDIGPLDVNYKPIGIEVDTGTGKGRRRVKQKERLAIEIAERISRTEVLDPAWLGPEGSYLWVRMCESAFVPIGHPDHTR